MEHYEFISKTDKRSLFNKIKFLVDCGQESYQNDLAIRRNNLRELLENEEQIYENEFKDKIKSRVDENIRERQESLLTMKEERTKERERFVAAKKLHQNMLNCLEIRDELRRKDYHETQICQLEQMNDKLRALEREKKDEKFWLEVQGRMEEKVDQQQRTENDLKKALQVNQCRILGNQLEEHRRTNEMDLAHKLKEKNEVDLKMKSNQGDEKLKALEARKARSEDAKKSLRTVCEQQQLLKYEAEMFENVFHDETMRQVNKEIEDSLHKSIKFKQDTLAYLEYMKKFKTFVADQDQKRNQFGDELDKRFFCFKNHRKKNLMASKQELAKSTHKTLLRQICEEQARRIKLEAAERENKLLENRFVKTEVRDKFKERLKVKKALDEQLEELNRLKAEKQKLFESELNRAEGDQAYCDELLEKHKIEGCDYLAPHPNWKLLACCKGDNSQIGMDSKT